jgi:ElaB/YqjD/DUF883 family membrane-anchored ribosome-binding protein
MQKHANRRTVVDRAPKFFVDSREFTKEQASQAKSFIQRKPIVSAFLGMGAGLLVGLFFSRRVPKVVVVVRPKGKAS